MENIIEVISLTKTMLNLLMSCMNITILEITLIVFPKLVPKTNYESIDPELLK